MKPIPAALAFLSAVILAACVSAPSDLYGVHDIRPAKQLAESAHKDGR